MLSYPSPAQRANRRRATVFLAVFAVGTAIGLAWDFSRPPQYLASARAQINPGSVQVQSIVQTGEALGADAPRSLLTEIQVLTSKPVIEETLGKMPPSLRDAVSRLGSDPVAKAQEAIEATPSEGTDVVRITAIGSDASFVASLVNGVIATYTFKLAEAYKGSATNAIAAASDEVSKLEAKVAAKRREVEAFRTRHDIVSLESQENEASIRARGLATSVVTANEKAMVAEGKRKAIEESIAAGKPIVTDRVNAILDSLEQRASTIREEIAGKRRTYTDAYLAMDPGTREQVRRLTELERQIQQQRGAMKDSTGVDQQAALATAREEAAAARDAATRLNQQLATNRANLQQFASRLNEYRALNDELKPLENLLRDAIQRKARLDAGEAGRRPYVQIIEAAKPPSEVWRPLYARDAAIVVGASFALALLVMWVVELFNRTDPAPTMLVQQPIDVTGLGYSPAARPALPAQVLARLGFGGAPLPPGATDAGEHPAALPRELSSDEVSALLDAAEPATRAAALLLLSGATAAEIAALRPEDVDAARGTVYVGGASARTIELARPVADALRGTGVLDADAWFGDAGGRPPEPSALASALAFAAHDARLARPLEVDDAALRHTFLAHLVRQGIRMADLVRIGGEIAPALASAYLSEAPAGKPVPLETVDRVVPGVVAHGTA